MRCGEIHDLTGRVPAGRLLPAQLPVRVALPVAFRGCSSTAHAVEQMDAAGIDFQVCRPSTQDPDAAAAELERAVTELGLVGGLINGHSRGRDLADPAYEGLFACAQEMGAPIYLHPTAPHPAVMEVWFAPHVGDGLGGDGSGDKLQHLPSDYLPRNFHITTSGNFCPSAFACTLEMMGADRVMFSADYPMDDGATRRKVGSENAIRLFDGRIPKHLGAPSAAQSANT